MKWITKKTTVNQNTTLVARIPIQSEMRTSCMVQDTSLATKGAS